MPKITVKTFDKYEQYLNYVYAEGMTETEAIEFFKPLKLAAATIIKNHKAKTLGKLVRKYDGQNFLHGYSEWVKDS